MRDTQKYDPLAFIASGSGKEHMASFDQRGQVVGNQVNSGVRLDKQSERERFEQWWSRLGFEAGENTEKRVAWAAWQAALKDQ